MSAKRQQESKEGSAPKRPRSELLVNENDIFARLSENFTAEEIKEIQAAIDLEHEHSFSLRTVDGF